MKREFYKIGGANVPSYVFYDDGRKPENKMQIQATHLNAECGGCKEKATGRVIHKIPQVFDVEHFRVVVDVPCSCTLRQRVASDTPHHQACKSLTRGYIIHIAAIAVNDVLEDGEDLGRRQVIFDTYTCSPEDNYVRREGYKGALKRALYYLSHDIPQGMSRRRYDKDLDSLWRKWAHRYPGTFLVDASLKGVGLRDMVRDKIHQRTGLFTREQMEKKDKVRETEMD